MYLKALKINSKSVRLVFVFKDKNVSSSFNVSLWGEEKIPTKQQECYT